jgi:hypothetical protein
VAPGADLGSGVEVWRRICHIFIGNNLAEATKERTMSKKHKGGPAPIPKGNQSHAGNQRPELEEAPATPHGAPASEQDPKRRLGNYGNAGEHAIEQPDGKKGSDHQASRNK